MSAQRNLVKQFFQTGDYPTETQFYQLFDNIVFKDEQMPITHITALQQTLQDLLAAFPLQPLELTISANGTVTIPAGYAVYFAYVKSATVQTIRFGTTNGADDLVGDFDNVANKSCPIVFNFAADNGDVIYISGISASTNFRFFLHKI